MIHFYLFFSALSDQEKIPPLPALSPPNSFLANKTSLFSFNEDVLPKSLSHLPPLINSHTAHKSLKKSVAALTAFHGFDQSSDQALDVLTDATSQFLSKFSNLLRHSRDKELSTNSKCGFPDIICRVYQEMGLGSILDMRSYYKNSIMAKHKAIGETAEALAFECHHLDEMQVTSHNSVNSWNSESSRGIGIVGHPIKVENGIG